MKKINPTASNRETEAMIRYALDHTEQLTPQERQRVHEYLSQKVVDGLPFEPEERALMQKMPEFRPDEDVGDVWMGDYVSREEMASAEYGYNIYDEGETLRALCRYRDAGEKIGRREADMTSTMRRRCKPASRHGKTNSGVIRHERNGTARQRQQWRRQQ